MLRTTRVVSRSLKSIFVTMFALQSTVSAQAPLMMPGEERGVSLQADEAATEFVTPKNLAEYYLLRRSDQVSSEELQSWSSAVASLLRLTSNQDQQISIENPAVPVLSQDLLSMNPQTDAEGEYLIDRLDVFYRHWVRARRAPCVQAHPSYFNRARAAFAAESGGPGRSCRWTEANEPFLELDRAFQRNYVAHIERRQVEPELSSVMNNEHATTLEQGSQFHLEPQCWFERGVHCGQNSGVVSFEDNEVDSFTLEGRVVKRTNGETCLVQAGILHCVRDERDRACLQVKGAEHSEAPLFLSEEFLNGMEIKKHERHELCANLAIPPFAVSSLVRAQKELSLYDDEGREIGVVPEGQVLQIEDFIIDDEPSMPRRYKVTIQATLDSSAQTYLQSGWINGGNQETFHEFLEESQPVASIGSALTRFTQTIARTGQWIRVKPMMGIQLRFTAGGSVIGSVGTGRLLKVLGVRVRSEDNSIFYRVQVDGKIGFIYSGRLLPYSTIGDWTEVVSDKEGIRL